MPRLLYPEQIDRRLNLPIGTAARMARQRKLPHVVLPNGSIRFAWGAVRRTLRRVPASAATTPCRQHSEEV